VRSRRRSSKKRLRIAVDPPEREKRWDPPEGVVPPPSSARPVKMVAAGCTLLLVFQWAASFLPGHLVWGIHHLAYIPVWARSLWTAFALILLWSPGPILARLELLSGRALARTLSAVLLVVAGGAVFWLLRNRTHFLGDGYLVAELMDRGVGFRTFDFLDFYLHALVWKLLQSGEGVSAFRVYAWASLLAGIGYLMAARWLSLRLVSDPGGRVLLFSLLVFAGPIQLFFGYVESYSFQAVFVLLYLGSAVLALRGEGSLLRSSLFFGLACAFHTTTLFLAPTLLYLAFHRVREQGALKRAVSTLLPALAVVVVAAAILVLSGYTYRNFEFDILENRHTRSIFLSLQGSHGLLSLYHLKDLVNLVLLLVPVPSLLLLVTLIRRPKALWEKHERRFLMVGAFFLTLLLIGVDRKLGGSRDWDLFAAHISVVSLLAVLSWRSWAYPEGSAPGKAGLLMVTALALVGPWVWVNGGEERSINRFRDMIADFSSFKRAYAHEEVAKHYRNSGDVEKALTEYQICVDTFPGNARFWALLGGSKVQVGRVDEAIGDYKKALEIEPDNVVAHKMLIQAYQLQGRPAETLPLFHNLTEKLGNDAAMWAQYGLMARAAREYGIAIEAMEKSIALQPSKRMELELGVAYGMGEKWGEADHAFRELLTDSDVGSRATLGLGTTLFLRTQKDPALSKDERLAYLREAAGLLEQYLADEPDNEDAKKTLGSVKSILEAQDGQAGR
jgi:tetratricopeptide (TPR) repeat protein